ncbi:MAG TPA: GNAT family N-acetyltransferase [Acidimicrobiales bacterium]|nr:GNAT family N-acetyltransferase [Acidimicrobiales bacterium]
MTAAHRATVDVRPLRDDDGPWKAATLRSGWGSTAVARRGELIDALPLDGFAALLAGEPAGLLTYRFGAGELEVVTIQAEPSGVGVGRALMDAAADAGERLGAGRIWLVTTNNNVRALAFYQRWGMDLVALDRFGVERSRAVKPGIPAVDADGIPIRHEIELERRLPRAGALDSIP